MLPRIKHNADYDGTMRIGGNYTNIAALLIDVIKGVCELKYQGSLLCCDNARKQEIGFILSIIEDDIESWWEYCIHIKDVRATEHLIMPELISLFKTQKGRQQIAQWLQDGKLTKPLRLV